MKKETYEYHFIINKKEIPVDEIIIDLEYNFDKRHNIITVEIIQNEKTT